MQLKSLFIASALLSLTLSIQASEKKIKESPCIKELFKTIDWKVNSPNPELVNFSIQQKFEECQKLGDGTPAEQLDKIIRRGIDKKNQKVVEYAVVKKYEHDIIKKAAFSNTMWYAIGQTAGVAVGGLAGWFLRGK